MVQWAAVPVIEVPWAVISYNIPPLFRGTMGRYPSIRHRTVGVQWAVILFCALCNYNGVLGSGIIVHTATLLVLFCLALPRCRGVRGSGTVECTDSVLLLLWGSGIFQCTAMRRQWAAKLQQCITTKQQGNGQWYVALQCHTEGA